MDEPYNSTVTVDPVLAESKDPLRSLRQGSLVRLNSADLYESHRKQHRRTEITVAIPYLETLKSDHYKYIEMRTLYHPGKWPKEVTFLVLSDLDTNNDWVHGWLTIVYDQDEVEMAKGWFIYNTLVKCIDFSGEDDS